MIHKALSYAKNYNPELVIDFALTEAASIIGHCK